MSDEQGHSPDDGAVPPRAKTTPDQLSQSELEEIKKDLIQYNTTKLERKRRLAARSATIFIRELKRSAV